MKIFTKLLLILLLTCFSIQWANAQASSCDAIVPELSTQPIIIVGNNYTAIFPPFMADSDLPNLEYAVQLIGTPATDSLDAEIIGFSMSNTINVNDFNLMSEDTFRVTPIAYDLSQIKALVEQIFNGTFFGAPCCSIVNLSLPGACTTLEEAGVSGGDDVQDLNDILTVLAVFNENADITYSVPGFINAVIAVNDGASSLPGSCGGSEIPICYAVPSVEQGSQLYNIIITFPIELTQFQAYAAQKYNRLKWTTATEENNAYFSIQHSANGQEFVEIGRVDGSGTTTDEVNYEFVDTNPIPLNYYRLEQVDFDGKSSFSDILSVVRKDLETLGPIYAGPNPTNGEMEVTIHETQSGKIDYVLTDINGKTLMQNALITNEGLNVFNVNITDFPSGIYFISIVKGELSTHLKFFKK